MNKKRYYIFPVQVEFFDRDRDTKQYGIAYKDEVICLCCGGIFKNDEVDIIEDIGWYDIKESLRLD